MSFGRYFALSIRMFPYLCIFIDSVFALVLFWQDIEDYRVVFDLLCSEINSVRHVIKEFWLRLKADNFQNLE